ncbi:MAG: NAD-dependent epimerase/dehydratase family protein [Alphaproteobacteria bacterium]
MNYSTDKYRICVTGAGGFIASHVAARLKRLGHHVVACDRTSNPHMEEAEFCDTFHLVDLRDPRSCLKVAQGCHHVFHLAAEMGGMGFISTHDATIMPNNTLMTVHMLEASRRCGATRFFFASSACVYPEFKQLDPGNAGLKEEDAWPAQPQDGYGLEKLYSEELCRHYGNAYGIEIRVARFHNVYGPKGTWIGGREKAPAALCRKVAATVLTGSSRPIEVWGDGKQTRSFMYVDDCVDGSIRLMESDCTTPLNLGSSEMISVDELVDVIGSIEAVRLEKEHLPGPEGVRGRNSDNTRASSCLGWEPSISIRDGIEAQYLWIKEQVRRDLRRGIDISSYRSSQVVRRQDP